ncbi:hypothetical protein MOV75_25035, partial [Bradyrhizobium sp. PRIMUS42]|nr:hypothetical protein [Bradyrhizobium sp. PRIMUS42]
LGHPVTPDAAMALARSKLAVLRIRSLRQAMLGALLAVPLAADLKGIQGLERYDRAALVQQKRTLRSLRLGGECARNWLRSGTSAPSRHQACIARHSNGCCCGGRLRASYISREPIGGHGQTRIVTLHGSLQLGRINILAPRPPGKVGRADRLDQHVIVRTPGAGDRPERVKGKIVGVRGTVGSVGLAAGIFRALSQGKVPASDRKRSLYVRNEADELFRQDLVMPVGKPRPRIWTLSRILTTSGTELASCTLCAGDIEETAHVISESEVSHLPKEPQALPAIR